MNRITFEDIGLTPEEINKIIDAYGRGQTLRTETAERLRIIRDIKTDHLRELARAEQDGRLVWLPCKVGDTVYVKGEAQVVECYIMEAYLDDLKGIEYLVSFKCEYLESDNACKGCPFYSWKQDYSGEWSCDGEYEQSCVIAADFGKTVFLTREEAEAAMEVHK